MASPRPARKRNSIAARAVIPKRRLDSPDLYLNPHLSLLAFQRRVLEEALDAANPLLERVKFVSILGSNIDEFFMVRVAGRSEERRVGKECRCGGWGYEYKRKEWSGDG